MANFEALHSRHNDARATACAFDLLMLNEDDLRKKSFSKRKAMLRKALKSTKGGIQYVEHNEGDGSRLFGAVCDLKLRKHRFKEAGFAVSIGGVEGLDQGQKPDGASRHARYRWNFLKQGLCSALLI